MARKPKPPPARAGIYFASSETQLPQGWEAFLYPQAGPQTELLIREETEILYGGARGGGKTVGGMLWLIKGNPGLPQDDPTNVSYINHPQYRALVLRRQLDDLKDWIDRAQAYYCEALGSPLGAVYKSQQKIFVFPSGAKIICAHLEDENAFHKYRGHQYHRILFEELTQIPTEELYLEVYSSCRSPHKEMAPQMLGTTNPDGPGLDWVRKRFLQDPKSGLRVPPKSVIRTRVRNPLGGYTENTRVFLPAKIVDNPALLASDPGYYARLREMSPAKQRAYIDGDWDALSGSQFFEDFRPEGPRWGEPDHASHCITRDELQIQPWWWRGASLDWGFNHPAVIYVATKNESDGRFYVYKEIRQRRVAAFELGCQFARAILPDLMEMDTGVMTLWASPDAFQARNADRRNTPYTIIDLFKEGVEYVIGKQSVYVPRDEELGALMDVPDSQKPEYLDVRERLESARVVIRRAANARIAGWEEIRKLLHWRGLTQHQAKFDIEYGLRLLHQPGGGIKYCEYYNSILRSNVSQTLPLMKVCRDTCPYLVEAIPRAIYDKDGEDVKKQDCNPETGLGGDDEIDSLRYLVGGFKRANSQEPKEMQLRRILERTAREFGGEIPGHLLWQAQAQAQKVLDRQRDRQSEALRVTRLAARRARPGSLRGLESSRGVDVWRGGGLVQ